MDDIGINKRIHDFSEKLISAPTDIVIPIENGEDRYLVIHRLMFHWTLQVYHYPDWTGYSDRWCFATRDMAVKAVAEWLDRGLEGEPEGWHRHPPSGRRRVGGDPATEYVAH